MFGKEIEEVTKVLDRIARAMERKNEIESGRVDHLHAEKDKLNELLDTIKPYLEGLVDEAQEQREDQKKRRAAFEQEKKDHPERFSHDAQFGGPVRIAVPAAFVTPEGDCPNPQCPHRESSITSAVSAATEPGAAGESNQN